MKLDIMLAGGGYKYETLSFTTLTKKLMMMMIYFETKKKEKCMIIMYIYHLINYY